jgi:hypothetical protein
MLAAAAADIMQYKYCSIVGAASSSFQYNFVAESDLNEVGATMQRYKGLKM